MKLFKAILKYKDSLWQLDPATQKEKYRKLRLFLSFTGDLELGQLKPKHFEEYLLHLKRNHNWAQSYLARIMIHLRRFVQYWRDREQPIVAPALVPIPKMIYKESAYLTEEEFLTIYNSIRGDTLLANRDRALVNVLWSSGLRISEVPRLLVSNVDWQTGRFKVMRSKTNEVREGYFDPTCIESLKKYLSCRQIKSDYLFVSHSYRTKGHSLTKRAMSGIVREIIRPLNLKKKVSCHSFRHGLATHLLRNGANLREVQEILGHKKLSTTQRYTHISNDDAYNAHRLYMNKPTSWQVEKKLGIFSNYRVNLSITKIRRSYKK